MQRDNNLPLPRIEDINSFVDAVRSYPVSVSELRVLVIDQGMPKSIDNLLAMFHGKAIFDNYENLLTNMKQLCLLERASRVAPLEELRSLQE